MLIPERTEIVVGIFLVMLLTGTLLLYEVTKRAAWLAASTVASLLFLVGAVLAIGVIVPHTLLLAPLWAGLGITGGIHLRAALHGGVTRVEWQPAPTTCTSVRI